MSSEFIGDDSWDSSDVHATGVCDAWLVYDNNGTNAIRNSYNISSVNDSAVGVFRAYFSTPAPDSDFILEIGIAATDANGNCRVGNRYNDNQVENASFKVEVQSTSKIIVDNDRNCVAVYF